MESPKNSSEKTYVERYYTLHVKRKGKSKEHRSTKAKINNKTRNTYLYPYHC